ncbi:cation:proton antiporter [Virgibacillus halodenitrificans]|nr:cation:proton antiporter [Virgibacillus halodenitrificans]
MIRFPDLYTRLHACSKCLMAGGISILMGCMIMEGISFASLKILALFIFILITNPIAIHAIVSLSYHLTPETMAKNNMDK